MERVITINLERYDELIRKEALFDLMTEGKELSVYPYIPIAVKPEEVSND